ncbi:MAG: hypothetical protein HFH13_06580 [Dorea sp.]|jgi:hypothetical protein|nr:hypothetical protein [Dorea sp.]
MENIRRICINRILMKRRKRRNVPVCFLVFSGGILSGIAEYVFGPSGSGNGWTMQNSYDCGKIKKKEERIL